MSDELNDVTIAAEDPRSPDGARLILAAGTELDSLYTELNVCPVDPGTMAGPGAVFLVARRGGAAIGCGAIRPVDSITGELKRMYVVPEARRKGLARRLLSELEALAPGLGYSRLVLETGIMQPAAIAMYHATGYSLCDPYGCENHEGWSVFFGKDLRSGNATSIFFEVL